MTMERLRQNVLVPITTEDRVNDLKSEWITDYYFKCQKKTRFNFVNVHLTEKAKYKTVTPQECIQYIVNLFYPKSMKLIKTLH